MNRFLLHFPNLLTSLRLAAAPVLAILMLDARYGEALVIFALAGLSDAADGFLARRFDLRTDLGRFLDPAADKLLMLAAFLVLVAIGEAPVWLAAIVIGRDLAIVVGSFLTWALDLPLRIQPSALGKATTAVQIGYIAAMLLVLLFGLKWPQAAEGFALVTAGFTLASGLHYAALWLKGLARASRTA